MVEAGDRIGWTNEDNFLAISFQFDIGHRTYFRKVEDDQFPVLNNDYTFDNVHLPSIFSVAVEVMDSVCPPGE